MQTFLNEFLNLILYFEVNSIYRLVCYPGDDFPSRVKMTIGCTNINLTPIQVHEAMLYIWINTDLISNRLLNIILLIKKSGLSFHKGL